MFAFLLFLFNYSNNVIKIITIRMSKKNNKCNIILTSRERELINIIMIIFFHWIEMILRIRGQAHTKRLRENRTKFGTCVSLPWMSITLRMIFCTILLCTITRRQKRLPILQAYLHCFGLWDFLLSYILQQRWPRLK